MAKIRVTPKSPKRPPPPKYDLATQRQVAALLVSFGGLTYEGITACQKAFPGMSQSSMTKYLRLFGDEVRPRAVEIVKEEPKVEKAKQDVGTLRRNAYMNLLEQLQDPEFIAKNKNLLHTATAWAIIEERSRLQVGLTDEIIDATKRFVAVVSRKGFDPLQVFHDVISAYEDEPDVTLPIDEVKPSPSS